jgi:hypothetical protein
VAGSFFPPCAALAKRHDVSRNLIRVWVRKLETGAFDDDARAADLLQEYEAKIAALERMVGRQALEIEFLTPAINSWATCRLNSMLWERCLAMAFILRKPGSPGQFQSRKMSNARGALHPDVRF